MGLGVIPEDVTAGGDFLDEIGTLADEFAKQEKSGARVVPGQQFQKFRGDCGIGAVVEGQRQFPGCMGVGNDGTEKMRAGVHRAVGGEAR